MPHRTDDSRGRATTRGAAGFAAVLAIAVAVGAVVWVRGANDAAIVTSGVLTADETALTALGSTADVQLALDLPAVHVQAQGLAELRSAQILDAPTATAAAGGVRLTVTTDSAAAGQELLDFLAVYLMTWAGESEIHLAEARLNSATDHADAAHAALAAYEAEIGIFDVGATLERAESELLTARTALAAATDPNAQAALDRHVHQLESQVELLTAALPRWRSLRVALDAAHAELVAATIAEDVALSEANALATTAVVDDTTSTTRSDTGARAFEALIPAFAVLLIGSALAAGLARRRRIIEETIAASRHSGPEPPAGPGQFSGPDPRVTAAVVHRPGQDIVPPPTARGRRKRFSVRSDDTATVAAR